MRNYLKKVVTDNVRSCQALVFVRITTHRLEAVHDEHLHIAECMDGPAKVPPMMD